MSVSTLKSAIVRNLLNIPGWRTNRKIVVIESDDWGSIRMPSKEIYNQLLKEGYRPDTDPYLRYDSLASEDDISLLFETLLSVKDKNQNPAVITANCLMANPDFRKIKESDFQEYFYEPFTTTLEKYPYHSKSLNMWKEGIKDRIFHPQFHGREHLNVDRWMKGLQNGDDLLHKAFSYEMLSISSVDLKMRFGYMEGMDYSSEEERLSKVKIIKEGLKLFEDLFGYKSKSFIANCYIWGKDIENTLNEGGVKYIQGIWNQLIPNCKGQAHNYKYVKHYMGQKNFNRQCYLIRNAFFEPVQYTKMDNVVAECLFRINIAFRWCKPAIIGAHRANFIGYIAKDNRETNLPLFRKLLKEIVKKWPDVEFMTSDQLGDLMMEAN